MPLKGPSLGSLLSKRRELNEFRHLLGFSQVGELPVPGFECRYLNSTQTPLFGIYTASEFFPAGPRESRLAFFRASDIRKKAERPQKAQLCRSCWSRGMLSLTMTTHLFSSNDAHIGKVMPTLERSYPHWKGLTHQPQRLSSLGVTYHQPSKEHPNGAKTCRDQPQPMRLLLAPT